MVVMQVEANLEEEKVRSEECRAVLTKYQERLNEMEVSVSLIILVAEHKSLPCLWLLPSPFSTNLFVAKATPRLTFPCLCFYAISDLAYFNPNFSCQ